MNTPVVTRIPPSPTGHLHIGTVRTALYNFLFAKKHGGTFILRSEDTDKERSTKEFEDEIREGLLWLGLETDEFYRQSERGDTYKKYLTQIIESDAAYTSIEESKQTPGSQVEVVRLRNPNKTISFIDEIRGEITFDTKELGDFVIARSVDDVLYHFAVVVDDHEMKVTHVIRGEDHIPNTPRQILIQEALGMSRPIYAHLPLILAPDRSKLSKRHGAVSLLVYQEEGFLPEAIINYLALLGWNPGTEKELFTLAELIDAFDLSQIQKGGAVFDKQKLIWFNREYITSMSETERKKEVINRVPERIKEMQQYSPERLNKLIPIIFERVDTLSDIETDLENGEYDFVFSEPTSDASTLSWKNDSDIKDVIPRLKKVIELLENYQGDMQSEDIKETLWSYVEETGKGEVLWPLRVALTGAKKSPDPFSIIAILGIDESIHRLNKACDTIIGA